MFNPPPAPRFVDTAEAARILGLSPRTLEKQRCQGRGPAYHKLGSRVLYALVELEAVLAQREPATTTYADASISGHATSIAASRSVATGPVRR